MNPQISSEDELDHLLFQYDRGPIHDPLKSEGMDSHFDMDIDDPSLSVTVPFSNHLRLDSAETVEQSAENRRISSDQDPSSKWLRIGGGNLLSEVLPGSVVDMDFVAELNTIMPNAGGQGTRESATVTTEENLMTSVQNISHINEEQTQYPVSSTGASSSKRLGRVRCTEPNCERYFSENGKMLRHRRTHHGFKFNCTRGSCNEEFESHASYRRHWKQIHECNKGLICGIDGCLFAPLNRKKLQYHRESKHYNIFRCKYMQCGATLISEGLLVQHVALNHGLLPELYCQYCGARFSSPKGASTHIGMLHSKAKLNKEGGILQCLFMGCNALFISDSLRCQHVSSEHKNMPEYHCPFCGDKFADARAAKIHSTVQHT